MSFHVTELVVAALETIFFRVLPLERTLRGVREEAVDTISFDASSIVILMRSVSKCLLNRR